MRAILLLAVVLFLADGTMDIFQIATQRSTWGKHGSGLSFKNRARALGTQIIPGSASLLASACQSGNIVGNSCHEHNPLGGQL
jgi:hypothetical protein